MVEHKCEKCNTIYYKKSHWLQHVNKKKPCVPLCVEINKDQCSTKKPQEPIKNIEIKNLNGNISTEENIRLFSQNQEYAYELEYELEHGYGQEQDDKIICKFCLKTFCRKDVLSKHIKQNCKVKKEHDKKQEDYKKQLEEKNNIIAKQEITIESINNKFNLLADQTLKLYEQITKFAIKQVPKNNELQKINKNINKLTETLPINSSNLINGHLINTIIKKDKTIEKLDKDIKDIKKYSVKVSPDPFDDNIEIIEENEFNNTDINDGIINKLFGQEKITLVINNVDIEYVNLNIQDIYVNATKLCKSTDKDFNKWINLENTKKILTILSNKIDKHLVINSIGENITLNLSIQSDEYDKIQNDIWIYSDLASHLIEWINLELSIEFNCWIKDFEVRNKNNLIKEQEKRIKLLESVNLKRQKRTIYSPNIIYLVTCDELLADRKYLIGKSKNLTNRLSGYDKISDFEVVYQKSFNTLKQCEMAEKIILDALENYKEKINKDRFILPIGEDIKIFTKIFDDTFSFLNK
jgi:hypothetical protein